MNRLVWLAVAAAFLPTFAVAQSSYAGRAGERIMLASATEMALARSAAPEDVSSAATILVFNGVDFDVGASGTNGVTCYVARTWPKALEPHCFDEEGSRTILPIHLKMNEMWIAGASSEDVEAAVEAGIADGAFSLPSKPVFSYMMSAEQVLYSETGEFVGAWEPHVMVYFPGLTQAGVGGTGSLQGAIVSDGGTPLANVVFVVPTAVHPVANPSGGH